MIGKIVVIGVTGFLHIYRAPLKKVTAAEKFFSKTYAVFPITADSAVAKHSIFAAILWRKSIYR